jgi:hypothetical protein
MPRSNRPAPRLSFERSLLHLPFSSSPLEIHPIQPSFSYPRPISHFPTPRLARQKIPAPTPKARDLIKFTARHRPPFNSIRYRPSIGLNSNGPPEFPGPA